MRRLRALVLIGGALTAAAVVSFGYVRPPAQAAGQSPAAVRQTQGSMVQHFHTTGWTDGGYYYNWTRDIGSSGGHAG